jgi:putative phosphoesterase
MLLGLLSDTHLAGADGRLEALLAGPLGPAEVLLHAGDYTGEGVLDHLEFADARPFYGVAGNMDLGPVARRLPGARMIDLGGLRVGLIHGWGPPLGLEERVLAAFPESPDLLVFGHSHQAYQGRRGRSLLINPGSAFDRRRAPRCTVALVEVGPAGVDVRFEETDG